MLALFTRLQITLQTLKDEQGQDLIEYVLIGALIAVASVTSMKALATAISTELGVIKGDI